jgi:hypothetical protein
MQARIARACHVLRIFFLVLFCGLPAGVRAETALGTSAEVARQPLQELVRKKRVRGQIYVTIPQARVFGAGGPYRAYCSPQIRAINSSNKTVEELVTGISYQGRDNKPVGSTVTRFFRVKVGKEETHYFYSSINADYCEGLVGKMQIIRCVYESGVDCTEDVRVLPYGAIPMSFDEKKPGE